MKKTADTRTVRMFNRVFKFRLWADWDRIESFFDYIRRSLQHLFVLRVEKEAVPFEQAVAKFQLNEHEIVLRYRALQRLAHIMLYVALIVFGYFLYQCFYGRFLGILLSLMVVGITLILAFRYHYWSFQLQQRRLGCSLKTWFYQSLLGRLP